MAEQKSYEEYQYERERLWEQEQKYLASEDAKAIADAEAKEQIEMAKQFEEKDIYEQLSEAGVAPEKQMTQTEELGEKFAELLNWYSPTYQDWYKIPAKDKKIWLARADDFLRASKEAGLAWIEFEDDNPELWTIKEIEIE